MPLAGWSRVLQFRSGPQEYEFYACEAHKSRLEDGSMGSGLFFATTKDPIKAVDPEEEYECDDCREP